jgi:hypothetical protein
LLSYIINEFNVFNDFKYKFNDLSVTYARRVVVNKTLLIYVNVSRVKSNNYKKKNFKKRKRPSFARFKTFYNKYTLITRPRYNDNVTLFIVNDKENK